MSAPPPTDHVLITYGTLAPGQPNHHVLDGLTGRWRRGVIRATLHPHGWRHFPGVVLAPDSTARTPAWAFESAGLPARWPRLDAFEGPGYARQRTTITFDDGEQLEGWVYALREPPSFPPDESVISP